MELMKETRTVTAVLSWSYIFSRSVIAVFLNLEGK